MTLDLKPKQTGFADEEIGTTLVTMSGSSSAGYTATAKAYLPI